MITLNKQQEEGLKIAVSRYKERKPYTCIAGYAGTGKTELVKFIIKELGLPQELVSYTAYTGKATLVLKERGCPNAMTAHKLLYKTFLLPNGQYYHEPKKVLDEPYRLIVVDEVSMIPKDMWDLLLSHCIHIIALGDPGQLPPIIEDNEILTHPHIFLSEIMRQAQESEIIKLTMDIRAGKSLQLFQGKEVQIIDKKDLVSGMFLWADKIICAKNKTRTDINNLVRSYLYENQNIDPVEGDKVICLQNRWRTFNADEDVLVNGTIGTIKNIRETYLHKAQTKAIRADIYPEGDGAPFVNVLIDYKKLTTGESTITPDNFNQISPKPIEVDYGYCITAWKAQGSEYDRVLVFEENFPFDKEERIKYLYTACTRAKKKLVIVRSGSYKNF